jgi:hypothetical protein
LIHHPSWVDPARFTAARVARLASGAGRTTPAPHRERLREPALRRLGNLPRARCQARPGREAREDVERREI